MFTVARLKSAYSGKCGTDYMPLISLASTPPLAVQSSADAALELDFGALYFRCRGVLNFGALYFRCRRVLSKAQLAGIQNPDPLVQTGLRIMAPHVAMFGVRLGEGTVQFARSGHELM